MKIDFNNVRKQACIAHDKLVTYLNECKDYEGYLLADPNRLEPLLNNIRMTVGAIASTFEPGDDEMKDVFSELYPEDKHMEFFRFEGED